MNMNKVYGKRRENQNVRLRERDLSDESERGCVNAKSLF